MVLAAGGSGGGDVRYLGGGQLFGHVGRDLHVFGQGSVDHGGGAAHRAGRGAFRFGFGASADDGDGRTHGHHVALLGQNLSQNAGVNGGHFGIYLIGSHFQYRLVLLDAVADLLEPFQNGTFHYAFAHFGHHHLDARHRFPGLGLKRGGSDQRPKGSHKAARPRRVIAASAWEQGRRERVTCT